MLLRVDQLHLSLGGREILSDVHLEIGEGEIYGLLGPNGAGKSTTIAAVTGLRRSAGGKIALFEREVGENTTELRRRLGVLPERAGFYNWMTAEDYLAFFAALHGKVLAEPQIAQRLAQVGLAPRAGQAIGSFSHGMRQRLGLARALIGDPDLLILDEPTSGLDPRGRRDIHDLLLRLAANGVGILLCTHLLDDVERLCQRIGILVEGRTVASGTIAELLQKRGQLSRFRLRIDGEPPADRSAESFATVVAREGDWWLVDIAAGAKPESVWLELMFRGWPIAEIAREGGGLEALYLALTEARSA
jgi:ABC-2 type transport system ATP-binding protein